jgi:hypothetical protein
VSLKRRLIFIAVPVLGLSIAFAADMRLTVDQLVSFIKSAVQLKQPDKQVAEYLRHVKLTNKLDDRTIEDLQGLGAGPKTVAALKDLGTGSANLTPPPPPPVAPPPPPPIPPPSSIEQAKILDEVRQYGLNYTKQLPNFLCVQVTRRYIDPARQDSWRLVDTVTQKLSFFDQREEYKLITVNGRTSDMPIDSLGGTTSAGEFGSMMKDIFSRESEASFDWEKWATLRGKRAYVFSYDIDQSHSRYHVLWDKSLEYIPAYRGLIYVDRDTNMVMRIVMNPYGFPTSFPVQQVQTILDYDYTKIGDAEFMVPLKAAVTSRTTRYSSKNDVEFRLYRKFGTETTITFTPDPLPEDKLKEKP